MHSKSSLVKKNKQHVVEPSDCEESLGFILRESSDGLWDWNLTTDKVYYSPRWKTVLGYDTDELAGHIDTWSSMIHDDDRAFVLQKVDGYFSGEESTFEVEIRMRHKHGHFLFIRSSALHVTRNSNNEVIRFIGTHVDITSRKKAELFEQRYTNILKMIAQGNPASSIYNEIAHIYEERHIGIRCSMLELSGNKLLHGGAPSFPKAYCDALHGLENGPNVGSCGTSTYLGQRVLVENIETDPKWENLKHIAMPHGMRSCWSQPIKSTTGKVLGAFGMYRDYPSLPNDVELNDLVDAARLAGIIMERDLNHKRIQTLAYNDELTGLSNRAHLLLTLDNLIKISARDTKKFAVLYIDVDNFKSVNDSLGHDAGDALLQELGLRLKSAIREIDYVARFGGDEFCIIIKEISDSYNAATLAQRCLNIVSTPVSLSGRQFIPACSIGIAHYPDGGNNLKNLLKAADTALYAAKDIGKNCYAFYDAELAKLAEYQFNIDQYLKEAIEKQQLSLVYQPQIDINTGEIVGVEALSRWYHPELGQVAPNDFIAIAERIGMIKPLTEWVMYTACKQAIEWRNAGFPAMRMAINISPSHLFAKDFIPLLRRAINETGMDAKYLELEMTESVTQTSQKDLSMFQDLKELGVLLAIDDFGTGYSSFASLKHLTVDYLKIDKYFIDDMVSDKKTRLLIASMIKMAGNLEYKIIAEGIETIEQLELLKQFQCAVVQGDLLSAPLDADGMLLLLNDDKQIKHYFDA